MLIYQLVDGNCNIPTLNYEIFLAKRKIIWSLLSYFFEE